MDADSLIKLTKANLKELVCHHFTVMIPQLVKEEVIDHAGEYPDSEVIKENLEKRLLKIITHTSSSKKGEEDVFAIFRQGKYDAVCSDDKKFIKRLRLFDIPYVTSAVFIPMLLKEGKLSIIQAEEKLESLFPYIGDDEYYAIKEVLSRWRKR
ncbi:MAG: hypothetical protein HY202_08815 [Nitrospirae bacterium]|nr:hypothetical protein [Nitrospirota bacterium]